MKTILLPLKLLMKVIGLFKLGAISFAEVNGFLKFDREKAKGTRLNIASGTSIRFEPGQKK